MKILISQKQLVSAIREFPLEVQDGMSFSQAQVCSGGVDTSQVNSQPWSRRLVWVCILQGSFWILTVHAADIICNGHRAAAVAGKNAAKEEKN